MGTNSPAMGDGQESLFRNRLTQLRRATGHRTDHVLTGALATEIEEWGFKPVVRWMHHYIKVTAHEGLTLYVYVLGTQLRAVRGFTHDRDFQWGMDLADPNCINGLHGFLTQMNELEAAFTSKHTDGHEIPTP